MLGGVRRLLLLVSAIMLVDTLFYAALTPLLPHYADTLGLSKTGAGVLTAAFGVGTLAGSIPAGMLAARTGPKPVALLGLALLAATSLAFGFGDSIAILDAARFCQGFGGACTWTGALAWLVSRAPMSRCRFSSSSAFRPSPGFFGAGQSLPTTACSGPWRVSTSTR